jgi:hypothetical protein
MKQLVFGAILIISMRCAYAQDTIRIAFINKKNILPGENAFFSFTETEGISYNTICFAIA